MMKMSTMRTVASTVDTHGESPIAAQILKPWGYYAWYIMDIAFALRDLFRTRIDLNSRSFLTFVRGYRGQHVLDAELVSQLPLFLRMARLLTYARLVRAMDLPPCAEDPAWLQSLRLKFENWLDDYRASLESPW